jgi:hypothetical protein
LIFIHAWLVQAERQRLVLLAVLDHEDNQPAFHVATGGLYVPTLRLDSQAFDAWRT